MWTPALSEEGVEVYTVALGSTMTATSTESRKATAQAIFSLSNLGCSTCSGIIEDRLTNVPGIRDVAVNYVTDTVFVNYNPARLRADDIRTLIKNLAARDGRAKIGG